MLSENRGKSATADVMFRRNITHLLSTKHCVGDSRLKLVDGWQFVFPTVWSLIANRK
ncbi:MAG: hypothetical protein LBI18_06435 [Planctomycetaceae bacterium]|nr:hypothetical protein [Planctomycetaceae bacterium]